MEQEQTQDYLTNVTVSGLKCQRCDHTWLPRKAGEAPLTCPGCHSAYWKKPRTRPAKVKAENLNGHQ